MTWLNSVGIGAIFGALGVGLGAFAAHGLKARLSDYALGVFETAVRYQMYHALALIAVGLLASRIESNLVRIASYSFIIGTIIFSGSLYTLALTGIKWLGAITPIGGLAFIVGWICFALAAFRVSP
ncbi:DUF423 domain-containing protein [Pseudobacteriovorax antillogorgiicola]|uniref:Uncharacterized membrane protein YgdD, TMEM256/DUF423 family n=1 Tax=Pseudobacteriovorax antillogorgiicola TaxID=1513793 RepID=A0A1Y6CH44_9BACT|nr:DUF423 domain-containing protein [Pseudobacteriovorax antillogorgiicola]TCS48706.1 uncharacterized membrane protein YgdD (TMEM256/DUF423 family) [Pseudobacteriovorax antillogorgiicola]SMF54677.1 Uncharacterized membrane protein YgdD, TMEM256/DUF423 family [Pseudobacteriovorax antillogorgiicola]